MASDMLGFGWPFFKLSQVNWRRGRKAHAKRDIRRKLKILEHAENIGNVRKICRCYGISRQSFYNWKKRYVEKGDEGLINSKPCPDNPRLRTPGYIEELILHLRRKYHFGPDRIAMYLDRYHQIKISVSGAYFVLRLWPQYTAIDDATRIRVMKVYPRHNQNYIIKFIDLAHHMVEILRMKCSGPNLRVTSSVNRSLQDRIKGIKACQDFESSYMWVLQSCSGKQWNVNHFRPGAEVLYHLN